MLSLICALAVFLSSGISLPAAVAADPLADELPIIPIRESKTKQTAASDEVIVKMKKQPQRRSSFRLASTESKKDALARRKNLEIKNEIVEDEVVVFETGTKGVEEVIEALQKDANVESVQPNYTYYLSGQDVEWNVGDGNVSGVNADYVWPESRGEDVVIAVIDSGVDLAHEDLADAIWVNSGETDCDDGEDDDNNGYIDDCYGWDFVGTDLGNPVEDNDPTDAEGHGTAVAGVIAMQDNDTGYVGVAPGAKIMALKAFPDGVIESSTDRIVLAIDYAIDNGADIINLSFAAEESDPLFEEAIDRAHAAGILVVGAGGNLRDGDPDFDPKYPAIYQNVIGVGAVDQNNNITERSNTGDHIDLVAPGSLVVTTVPESFVTDPSLTPYARGNGTSIATPHVAAIAALLLGDDDSLTPDQLKVKLIAGAIDLGAEGKDDEYGYGLADAVGSFYGKAQPGEVIINELAWAGSSASSADEWIELKNMTNRPLNIGNYQLTKISVGNEREMLRINAGIVKPNDLFLIANYNQWISRLAIDPDIVSSKVSMLNGSLQVGLYDADFETDGSAIDIAGDASSPFAGSNSEPKSTMNRTLIPGDGTVSSNWFAATVQGNNFDAGVTDLGTPGEENETPATDETAPVISNPLPTGEFSAGTVEATLRVTTDEEATCKYDTIDGEYDALANMFATSGTTSHAQLVTGLQNNTAYTYYVRCADSDDNKNTTSTEITFSIAEEVIVDATPPVISNAKPTGELAAGTTEATLEIETDETATCKYDTTDADFDTLANTFSATGSAIHTQLITGLTDNTSYTFYVRCADDFDNKNTTSTEITFSVAEEIIVDSTPSVISNVKPSGELAFTTTGVSLEVTTDETASCKYGDADADFDSLANAMNSGDGLVHTKFVTGLSSGNEYTYYVRCNDSAGNANGESTVISFTIAEEPVVNNNPRDELFMDRISGTRWYIAPVNAAGTNFEYDIRGNWSDENDVVVSDFNGDGRDDMVIRNKTTGAAQFAFTNSSGTDFTYVNINEDISGFDMHAGDFNNDGKADLFLKRPNTSIWRFAITNANATGFDLRTLYKWKFDYEVYTGDFDGDTRTDLFLKRKDSTVWMFALTKPNAGGFTYKYGRWKFDYTMHPGDYDGDGKDELFLKRKNSKVWIFATPNATTSGFTYKYGTWKFDYSIHPGDYNGDGRDDLFLQRDGSNVWIIAKTNETVSGFGYNYGRWSFEYNVYPGEFYVPPAIPNVEVGSLNFEYQAVAQNTVQVGDQDVELAKFQVTAGSAEDVLLQAIILELDGSSDGDITNMYIEKDGVVISDIVPSANANEITFDLTDNDDEGLVLEELAVVTLEVKGDVATGVDTDLVVKFDNTALNVAAAGLTYGFGINTQITGVPPIISIDSGDVTFTIDSSARAVSPDTQNVRFGSLTINNSNTEAIEIQKGLSFNGLFDLVNDSHVSDVRLVNVANGQTAFGPVGPDANGKIEFLDEFEISAQSQVTFSIQADIGASAPEGHEYALEIDMITVVVKGLTTGNMSYGGGVGFNILPDGNYPTEKVSIGLPKLTLEATSFNDGVILANTNSTIVYEALVRANEFDDLFVRGMTFSNQGSATANDIDSYSLYIKNGISLMPVETEQTPQTNGGVIFNNLDENGGTPGLLVESGNEYKLVVVASTKASAIANRTIDLTLTDTYVENEDGDIASVLGLPVDSAIFTITNTGLLSIESLPTAGDKIQVAGSTDLDFAKYKFIAQNEDVLLESIVLEVVELVTANYFSDAHSDTPNDRNAIQKLALFYDDGTSVKKVSGQSAEVNSLATNIATFSDLDLIAKKGEDLVIEVKADLRDMNSGVPSARSRSGHAIAIKLDASESAGSSFTGLDSNSTIAPNVVAGINEKTPPSKPLYVFNDKVIAEESASQPSGSLVTGTMQEILKFDADFIGDTSDEPFLHFVNVAISGVGGACVSSSSNCAANDGVVSLYNGDNELVASVENDGSGQFPLMVGSIVSGSGTLSTDVVADAGAENLAGDPISINGETFIIKADLFTNGVDNFLSASININSDVLGIDDIVWIDGGSDGTDGVAVQWIDLGTASSVTEITNTLSN